MQNQRRNAAHYMTFSACRWLIAGANAILPTRRLGNQQETLRDQGRNAAHYRSFSACKTLIARAKLNITSTPAPEPTGTNAEPAQECCSLHDVLSMPMAHSRGRMQYYQHAGHGTKRNRCGTKAGILLITRRSWHVRRSKQGQNAILPARRPRNQQEPMRNQRRNAAICMTFSACRWLIAGANAS